MGLDPWSFKIKDSRKFTIKINKIERAKILKSLDSHVRKCCGRQSITILSLKHFLVRDLDIFNIYLIRTLKPKLYLLLTQKNELEIFII
jgi:hypothetical protein